MLISTSALQMGITSLALAPTFVRMFGVSRAVFRYLERLVSHDVTFRLLARLRVWFYQRIEPLSPAQLKAFSSGDLMSRVVSDIEELQNLYIRVVAPPVVAVVINVIVGVSFALIDPLVALVAVGFMLAAGTLLPALTLWIGNVIGKPLVQARADLDTHMVDSIQGLPDSIAYGYAADRFQTLNRINNRLTGRERQAARLDGLQTGLGVLLVNLAAFSVLFSAVGRVEGVLLGTVTLGIIAAFEAITPLALATQHLGREMTAARRVFEVIDTHASIDEPAQPAPAPADDLTLDIDGLTFRYAPDEMPVFRQFSLRVPYGQHIVVMGESGAGKSSLVNILMRFWEYDSGQITIGGVDLKTLAHEDLRGLIGVMTQRTHLFNTTIRENIRIARKTATEDEVVAAAQAAQVHDFILSLPQGYDTYVGEDGVSLSGGERQRVALARILLKDSPVWMLDEITANLDPITANAVMAAVLAAAQDRTVILMTHNIALVDRFNFDQVIELHMPASTPQAG